MPYDPEFIKNTLVPLPTLSDRVISDAFEQGTPIDHSRFSVVLHQNRGFAIFTAHNIDGNSIIPEGAIRRRNNFRLDPEVPDELQVDNNRGYRNNPWDRGHLVRRRALHWGDRDLAKLSDSESFYWTNIAPQHHQLHHSAWGKIENWMFDVSDDEDRRACIFTGPVFSSEDPEHLNEEGEKPIRIPAGFWKLFAIKHRAKLRAAAFLVWQRDFDRSEPVSFDPILEQVRITTLEYLTGLAFPALREADPLRFKAPLDVVSRAAAIQPEETVSIRNKNGIIKPTDIVI